MMNEVKGKYIANNNIRIFLSSVRASLSAIAMAVPFDFEG